MSSCGNWQRHRESGEGVGEDGPSTLGDVASFLSSAWSLVPFPGAAQGPLCLLGATGQTLHRPQGRAGQGAHRREASSVCGYFPCVMARFIGTQQLTPRQLSFLLSSLAFQHSLFYKPDVVLTICFFNGVFSCILPIQTPFICILNSSGYF